ncbi:MAG: carbohydrate kinase family protein [Thermoprotei archaeon]
MPEVVTVGHILMDIQISVDDFAQPDREGVVRSIKYGGGGSAANVAVGTSRLGIRSGYIGKVGMDSFGSTLLEEIRRDGVDVSRVKIDFDGSTGFTIIIVNKDGQVVMYGFEGVSDKLMPDELDVQYIGSAEHLHITGLRLSTAVKAAKVAKKAGVVVSFDPGRLVSMIGMEKLKPLLRLCDILLLNSFEAGSLTNTSDPREAAIILNKVVPVVIVKMGDKGVYVKNGDNEFSIPAHKVKVVDTTGAGDAFSAGFITGLLEGKDLRDSVSFANAVAALKITKMGARALPTRREVEQFIKHLQ